MKMQIVSCPRCGTFLLNDTAECHGCGHVVGHHPHSTPQLESRVLPTDSAVQNDMDACPNCGETCRTGLVRCWNCSSFLRPDIEASYRRMQELGRQAIEHVDLQILEASSVTEEDSLNRRVSTPEAYLASHPYATDDLMGEDDFELSSDAQFGEDDDERFDLMEIPQLEDHAGDSSMPNDQETFRLQESTFETPVLMETSMDSELPEIGEPPLRAENIEPPIRAETSEPPVRSELSEPPVRSTSTGRSAGADDSMAEELLKIAADEEKDIQQVRKSQRSKNTFLIFCPQGCRIRVKEKHRGKSGKCPRCQCEFVVPRKAVSKKAEADDAKVKAVPDSRFKKWLNEIRLHTVDPVKLRIKADSLLNECQAVDLGFSADDLLIATLIVGKFGANVKKTPSIRTVMIEHFLKQGTIDALTIAAKKVYTKELLAQFNLAQPVPKGTESLFADIPVFGTNRIAVRIPKMPDEAHSKYLSFCLSEYRAFVEGMQSVCGIEGFGTNVDVPLSDEYATHKCHLSKAPVLELASVKYYEKDPGFKLEVSGWRCAACGIVISEAARAESKLGGANGKGLAKAKCPKCSLKYGNLPLHQFAGAGATPPAADPSAAAEPEQEEMP